MSEFKGKKENWVKSVTAKNKIIVSIGSRRDIELGTIYYDDCDVASCCKTEEHANALLISKAPEMLQDLIDIVWLIEMGATLEELNERIKTSKQLIKEATEL